MKDSSYCPYFQGIHWQHLHIFDIYVNVITFRPLLRERHFNRKTNVSPSVFTLHYSKLANTKAHNIYFHFNVVVPIWICNLSLWWKKTAQNLQCQLIQSQHSRHLCGF